MSSLEFQIVGIFTLAIFSQCITGFGMALVAMPLLILVIEVDEARALVPVIGIISMSSLLIKYRAHIIKPDARRLLIGALPAIPFGFLAPDYMDRSLVLGTLGALTILFALYSYFKPRMPLIEQKTWVGYVLGSMSGFVWGAYNVGAPPLAAYGSGRRWEPSAFRANVPLVGITISVFVILGHFLKGNYEAGPLFRYILLAVPGLVFGLTLGFALNDVIPPKIYKIIVTVMLVAVGTKLLFT